MARLPNMQSRQMLARSVDSLARACAFAWSWACSSMFGMDDMELPRVRTRVNPPTVGERGGAVDSVTRDDLRAWRAPGGGAGVAAVVVLLPPNARARGFGLVGGSGRGGGGRGRLRVEQDRLGHGGRLILGNDDAAVAGVVEVDLRQRPVVAAAGRQGGGVQRVGLAVGVVERVGFGIQQVSRVAFLGGRVEDRGRGGVRRVCALAAAEEVSDHGGQRAHSSMEACSWP